MSDESYQTSADGYRALREAAALGTIERRGQIGVSGKDRAGFLQGLLTNDMLALDAGGGCYAAWLTAQGRMLTDLYIFEAGDMMLVDVPLAEVGATLARLDQYLFGEDVQLSDLSAGLRAVGVHGPAAARAVEQVVHGMGDGGGLDGWPQYHHVRADFAGAPVVVARLDQLGVPGFRVYVGADAEAALRTALREAGVVTATPADLEAARIEAGHPVFGVDMTNDTIPLEAGIEQRAISFTKGCYVGQEVVIRVLHRGHGRVARRLVVLRVAGEPPAPGAVLYAPLPDGAAPAADQKAIGTVTSAARSPRFGAIAFAYVGRDFTAAGTAIVVDAGGRRVAATVSERPIPSAS